jgi:hypothetical protein
MNSYGNKKVLGILLLCAVSNVALFAQGSHTKVEKDSLQYQWDRFSVSLGGFLTTVSSDLSIIGEEMGLGLSVNLEEALGLSSSIFVLRGESEYNFGSRRRSHVRFGYFYLLRNSVKSLENEIEIGDVVYPIGTDVNSKMDLHIIRALYDYSFYRDRRASLGLSVGLYILPMSYSIGVDQVIDEADAFILPLPVIGFRSAFLITPKIIIKQNWELLYVKTTNFKGDISDFNVWLEYHPLNHLGIGLGLNSFRFSMTATEEWRAREFAGTFKTRFTGILLYGKYYF